MHHQHRNRYRTKCEKTITRTVENKFVKQLQKRKERNAVVSAWLTEGEDEVQVVEWLKKRRMAFLCKGKEDIEGDERCQQSRERVMPTRVQGDKTYGCGQRQKDRHRMIILHEQENEIQIDKRRQQNRERMTTVRAQVDKTRVNGRKATRQSVRGPCVSRKVLTWNNFSEPFTNWSCKAAPQVVSGCLFRFE